MQKATIRFALFFAAIVGVSAFAAGAVRAQDSASAVPIATVDATNPQTEISPLIYGQFIEHLGRCIYGGIWSEVLQDRKFYDAPNSPGSPWFSINQSKPEMSADGRFVGEHSPKWSSDGAAAFGVGQHVVLAKDEKYVGYVWANLAENQTLSVRVPGVDGKEPLEIKLATVAEKAADGYQKYPFEFVAPASETTFEVVMNGEGTAFLGTASLMPADNVDGMRVDTLALLKELDSPIYRWPGGNFVSGYDWNDGIGDRDRRPPRKNPAWQGIEHNDFGFDEFMVFCRYLGTEPYIAVNTGAGEVENALAELEYANGDADTPQGKRRAANGNAEPYRIRYWGIGNEMFGDWQIGHMPVEKYAEKNNRFVDAFRNVDPNLTLVAVGAIGSWDETIMRRCADHMDLISEHFYVQDAPSVVRHARLVSDSIRNIANVHRRYRNEFPELKGKNIRIAMDEWNYWYGPHVFGELGTRYFVKDGLGIACGLHEFYRNSDIYEMANYAQTVNVIGCIKTSPTNAQFETTGLVLALYRRHFGQIPFKVASPDPLDVAAATTEDGQSLTIGIVNPTQRSTTLKINVDGLAVKDGGVRYEIVGEKPGDYNDPDEPQKINVVESRFEGAVADGIELAPLSVVLLKLEIAK